MEIKSPSKTGFHRAPNLQPLYKQSKSREIVLLMNASARQQSQYPISTQPYQFAFAEEIKPSSGELQASVSSLVRNSHTNAACDARRYFFHFSLDIYGRRIAEQAKEMLKTEHGEEFPDEKWRNILAAANLPTRELIFPSTKRYQEAVKFCEDRFSRDKVETQSHFNLIAPAVANQQLETINRQLISAGAETVTSEQLEIQLKLHFIKNQDKFVRLIPKMEDAVIKQHLEKAAKTFLAGFVEQKLSKKDV